MMSQLSVPFTKAFNTEISCEAKYLILLGRYVAHLLLIGKSGNAVVTSRGR